MHWSSVKIDMGHTTLRIFVERESPYCAVCNLLWHHAMSLNNVSSEIAEEQGKGGKKILLH